MGRPTKFNPERAAKILQRLRTGASRKSSAESVGITYDCFLDWVQRGEKATSGDLFDFAQEVRQAEADVEVFCAAVLKKAAEGWDVRKETENTETVIERRKITKPDGTVIEEPVPVEKTNKSVQRYREFDWRAALEVLKRRRRDEWSEKSQVEHSGPDGGPITIREVVVEVDPRDG